MGNGYGSLVNGKWTGLVGDVRTRKADMALIDLSITSARQKACDFTMPFMNTGRLGRFSNMSFMILKFEQKYAGVGILYYKGKPPPPNLWSFLQPLSPEVWIYMTTTYMGVSILMFLLAR